MDICNHDFDIENNTCLKCGLIEKLYIRETNHNFLTNEFLKYDFSYYSRKKYLLKILIKNHLTDCFFQDYLFRIFLYLDKINKQKRLMKISNKINRIYQYYYNTDILILKNYKPDYIDENILKYYYDKIQYEKHHNTVYL